MDVDGELHFEELAVLGPVDGRFEFDVAVDGGEVDALSQAARTAHRLTPFECHLDILTGFVKLEVQWMSFNKYISRLMLSFFTLFEKKLFL